MNKVINVVVAVMTLGWWQHATAQESENAASPVELFACTFKEGKGMGDMRKVNEKFAKWSKKNGGGYTAWTITPQFRDNDGKFDIGWIGSWNTGPELGKGLDKWLSGNDGLGEAYAEVIDCSHAMASSVAINAPDGSPEDGVVWFSSCTLSEGKNHRQAFEGHKKFSAIMREMGGKGQSWLFYPVFGFSGIDFHYFSVVSFKNYEELGEAWHLYTNGGGYQKHMELLGGVSSCDSPRVYDARQVVAPKS